MAKTKGRHEAEIRIACIQMEPKVGRKKANVAKSLELMASAAKKGANLVVLPELANSGYVFETDRKSVV